MATDYNTWELMTLHATGESGRTVEQTVRLGPSHRRWLVNGITRSREELFKYVERRLGERLVHLGRQPLLTPPRSEGEGASPSFSLPFRVKDKVYDSGQDKFFVVQLKIQLRDDNRIVRAMSVRCPLPLHKIHPWVELDKQTDKVPYFVNNNARMLLPGNGITVAVTLDERKELKNFLGKMSDAVQADREMTSATVDLVPLFGPDYPALKEVLELLKTVEQRVAEEGEVQSLVDAVTNSYRQLLTHASQNLWGSQVKLDPRSDQPDFANGPHLYAANDADHTVGVDQLLRGIRMSHCGHSQRISPQNQFVRQVMGTRSEEDQAKLLEAERQWVRDASVEILKLVDGTGERRSLPAAIVDYRKALTDTGKWLRENGEHTWDTLSSAMALRPAAAATSVILVTNNVPGHRAYCWPLLGMAVVACDFTTHTREQMERELFMREVLGIDPANEPFDGYKPSEFAAKLNQNWSKS